MERILQTLKLIMENDNIKKYNPKVSIIIPTYNVEPYLLKCLKSIADQTYNNIECIIIIDGATDHSFDIAKDFCKHDNRFNVYWQENAGSGPARNNGIEKATGEYIMFVDPDDYIDNNYVEQFVNYQELLNVDFITSTKKSLFYSPKGILKKTYIHNITYENINGKNNVRNNFIRLTKMNLVGGPHCKLYKREIINRNNIRFPDLRRSQDIVFNLQYYNYINNLVIIPYVGYNYRISEGTLYRLKYDYYKTILLLHNLYIDSLKEWGIYYNIHEIAKISYERILTWLESLVEQNINIDIINDEKEIRELVKLANNLSLHYKLLRFLILNKSIFLLKSLIHIKHYIKKKFLH